MSTVQHQPAQRASGGQAQLTIGACTDRAGRESNEDHCTSEGLRRAGREALGTLIAVADGMGGGEAGKTASSLAIGTLSEAYFESGSEAPLASLQHAVAQANSAVYAFTVNTRKAGSVGTTIVAAAVVGSRAYLVNVGDSRAYLIREGQARQITVDHNWATQQVEQGRMSFEQAQAQANAPLLTHVLGQGASLQIPLGGHTDSKFSFQLDLRPGDALLLCSDGVSGVVPPQELAELALSAGADRAAIAIVSRARESYRTADNATALVIQYGVRVQAATGASRWLIPAGGGIAAALAIVATVFALAGGGSAGSSQATPAPAPTQRQPALITTRVGASPTMRPTLAANDGLRGPTSTTLPPTLTPIPPTPTNTAIPRPTDRPPVQIAPRKTPVPARPTVQIPTVQPPSIKQPTATEAPPTQEPPPPTVVLLPTETPTPNDDDDGNDEPPPDDPQPPPTEAPPAAPPEQPEPPPPTDGPPEQAPSP